MVRHNSRIAPETAARAAFLRLWVVRVSAAEAAGFLIPVSAMAVCTLWRCPPVVTWIVVALSGAGEGALLGFGQATALRRSLGEWPVARWVATTAGAAVLAWAIGMAPSSLADLGVELDMARPATWTYVFVGGILILISIPAAQSTVLVGRVERAWRWVPISAAGWLAGVAFTAVPGPFINEQTSISVLTACYAAAGLAMALTVATATGFGMQKMVWAR